MNKVGVIDFGLGNLFSVQQALKVCGSDSVLINSAAELNKVKALVLPGVGAFGQAMKELKLLGLDSAIKNWVLEDKPLLGVCLGLQLLLDSSEEFGDYEGLGIIPGRVKKFPVLFEGQKMRVPHMGWSAAHFSKSEHPSLEGIQSATDMYFVHSYYAQLEDPSMELTWTDYQGLRYTSSAVTGNVWAFQFHPEKSAVSGLRIYQNWIRHIS